MKLLIGCFFHIHRLDLVQNISSLRKIIHTTKFSSFCFLLMYQVSITVATQIDLNTGVCNRMAAESYALLFENE